MVNKFKVINGILLALAVIACIVGLYTTKKAASDFSKISVQIVNKNCYKTNNGYQIDFTYKITNKTKVNWAYLRTTTKVYDKGGKYLGEIATDFGHEPVYGTSDLYLKVGETVSKSASFESNRLEDFFATLYNSNISNLKFESVVTYGSYYK